MEAEMFDDAYTNQLIRALYAVLKAHDEVNLALALLQEDLHTQHFLLEDTMQELSILGARLKKLYLE